MKKLCIGVVAVGMGISSVFAAYQPSMGEEKAVDVAGSTLLQIVETKHDGNYELLLGILTSFETKVAGDERKVWILDTLISMTMDTMSMMMKDEMMEGLVPLENVVGSKTIRGVTFDGTESGSAKSVTTPTGNHVYAVFDTLPDAGPDNFYEGWIVRQGANFNFFSTGELEKKDGYYVNDWMIDENIDDHTFYVLTLEPNDNDPAPAEHILEDHVR